MAVGTFGKFQRFLEVAIQVAGSALDHLVLAFERILGFRVIEILAQTFGDALPSQGGVAGRARLLEAAMMRVLVAVVALAERKTLIARLAAGSGRVTFLALDLLMLTGERVARPGMVERLRDVLPVIEVVARLAFLAEPSLVKILVTGSAGGRRADEGPVRVLHLDQGALAGGDVLGRVALLAIDADVLSFEHVARLFMIEGFGVPFDNGEIHTIVVGVALDTFLAGAGAKTVGKVKTLVRVEATSDLRVTFKALKRCLSTRELVTIGTMRSAVETLVSAGERARRDLRGGK